MVFTNILYSLASSRAATSLESNKQKMASWNHLNTGCLNIGRKPFRSPGTSRDSKIHDQHDSNTKRKFPVFQAIEIFMFIPFKKFCAIPFPSKTTICNHHQKMLHTLKNMFSSGTASNLATYSSWHLGSSIILQDIPTL